MACTCASCSHIAPEGVIHPHVDANLAARRPHKIHIPIQTSDQVKFFVDPEWHQLAIGYAYEANNLALHAVKNEGTTGRIHLILEYYNPDAC